MGAVGCNVAPSLLSPVLGQADQSWAEQSLPAVPDTDGETDAHRLFVQGPDTLVVL